jgi:hypothetical protein
MAASRWHRSSQDFRFAFIGLLGLAVEPAHSLN